jgi:malate/lactate dehydrogenase
MIANVRVESAQQSTSSTHTNQLTACTQNGCYTVQQELTTAVQQRGAAVIAARKLSSALSAANAIAAHLRDWLSTHPPKSDGTLKHCYSLSFSTDSVNAIAL